MIKKYNQFVKESDTPEEFNDENDYNEESDENTEYVTTELPDSEDGFEGEEEEEAVDFYKQKLDELADMLGVKTSGNKIEYEGKSIIFPSETEKYHVDRKKFRTTKEVFNYLTKK